jgi:hypothetical protein
MKDCFILRSILSDDAVKIGMPGAMPAGQTSAELDARSPGFRLQSNLLAGTRHAILVDDKQHVVPGTACAGSFGATTRNSPLRASPLLEGELHVPVAGGQTMRVVIPPKNRAGSDLAGRAADLHIEVAAIRNLPGRRGDCRPGRPAAAGSDGVGRVEDLADGNTLVRDAAAEDAEHFGNQIGN